jgi:CRISPR-associated exonuclease Cas4
VMIEPDLRQAVVDATAAVREMLACEALPPPLTGEAAVLRCKACSLKDRCQPEAADAPGLAALRLQLFDPEA